MKKTKKLLILAVAALTLGTAFSCNGTTPIEPDTPVEPDDPDDPDTPEDPDDPDTPEDPDTPDTPDDEEPDEFKKWTNEQKELMKKYCGGILPYPEQYVGNLFGGEYLDSNNDPCFVLYTGSFKFQMKEYYNDLEKYGWTTITSYKGDKVQKSLNSDGTYTEYVELTKNSDDGTVGCELMYYFLEEEKTTYLVCYNNFTASSRTETNWTAEDDKVINYVTTTTIPYIATGKDYGIYAENENEVDIFDYYTKDLSKDYVDILSSNGYVLNDELSETNDAYVLSKTLDNGAIIDIAIKYFKGNNFYVYYTPNAIEYTEWPENVFASVESASGVKIPEFTVAEGGTYKMYEKHGRYYLYTLNYDYGFDYEGYIENVRSALFNWEETLDITAYILTDDDYNNVGFYVSFEASEPTSTFVSSWPSDAINDLLNNSFKVNGVDVPSLDLAKFGLEKDSKYTVTTQEEYDEVYAYYLAQLTEEYKNADDYSEEAVAELAKYYTDNSLTVGMTIGIYDKGLKSDDYIVRYQVNEAYIEALYRAGWYKDPNTYNGETYEDPTGQVAINVQDYSYGSIDEGYTRIRITKGSGEAHTPVFEFEKETYDVYIGGYTVNVNLQTSMIPYDIKYTSSDPNVVVDENGEVKALEGAVADSEVTIEASYTDKDGVVHSTSCIVVVKQAKTFRDSIQDVKDLLKAKGYTNYQTKDFSWPDDEEPYATGLLVNFGSSLTFDEVKEMAEHELVPNYFDSDWWEPVYEDEDDEDDLDDEDDDLDDESLIKDDKLSFETNYRVFGLEEDGNDGASSDVDINNYTFSESAEKMYCYSTQCGNFLALTYYVDVTESGDVILYIETL